jgi:hypothetical protein
MAKKKAQSKPVRDTSRDDLSTELDVHSETIGRYDREGAPFEKRGRANWYNVPEYRAWMTANGYTGEKGRPIEGDSPDLEAARLRKENALAAKYELQVRRDKRELVPAIEVRQWIGQHVITFRNRLISLPASVTPHLEGRDAGERQTILEERITEVLNELARAVEGVGGGATPA